MSHWVKETFIYPAGHYDKHVWFKSKPEQELTQFRSNPVIGKSSGHCDTHVLFKYNEQEETHESLLMNRSHSCEHELFG